MDRICKICITFKFSNFVARSFLLAVGPDHYSAIQFHIGEGALECHLPIKCSEKKVSQKSFECSKNRATSKCPGR